MKLKKSEKAILRDALVTHMTYSFLMHHHHPVAVVMIIISFDTIITLFKWEIRKNECKIT